MSEPDTALSEYITRARNVPTLTREEEHELAVTYRDTRDAAAGDRLVRANMRHVVSIALLYRRYGLRTQDLIAEGNVGLVTALNKFDPEKGTRFVTYAAYWIRAYVLNFIIRSWSMVGSGAGPLRSKLFFRLRRERARLNSLVTERDQALSELATRVGIPVEKLEPMLQRLDGRDVSLDQPLSADNEQTRLDSLQSFDEPQDEVAANNERASLLDGRVKAALATLDKRERFIVERRILADEELSLAELGRKLGVSRERARQLEARAKTKLRRSLSDLAPANDQPVASAA